MTEYIVSSISPMLISEKQVKPWWKDSPSGLFSVKLAWDLIRKRKSGMRSLIKYGWRGSFKMNIFLLRGWKGRIATDDNLKMMRINIVSKCWSCETQQMETMSHLFLTVSIAEKLWKYFASCARNPAHSRMNLMQTINSWWYAATSNKLQYRFESHANSYYLEPVEKKKPHKAWGTN